MYFDITYRDVVATVTHRYQVKYPYIHTYIRTRSPILRMYDVRNAC